MSVTVHCVYRESRYAASTYLELADPVAVQ